jgi:hypothetical protein
VVKEATNPQRSQVRSGGVLPDTPLGYGYLSWTLPGSDYAFSAWGLYEQFIYVNPAYEPGFAFSQLTTNLIKCDKPADGLGFACDRGGAEVKRRWVRHKIGRFNCRSIAR